MRINLSTIELSDGKRVSRFGKVQLDKLRTAATQKAAIRVSSGATVNGKRVGLVIPTGLKPVEDNKHEFSFVPFWTRAFSICHMRSTSLRALVVETEKEKVMISAMGVEPCTYTTSGAGVGLAAEESAELLLGNLIDTQAGNPVVQQAVQWLAQKVQTKN